MLELITLLLFVAILLIFLFLKLPIAIALLINLFLFIVYLLKKSFSPQKILSMIYDGFKSCALMLFIFMLIGMITGIWRSCGTISYIIYHAVSFISPKYFYLGVFLFNSIISMLTGTSFGTCSTAGVISMSLGLTLGMNPYLTGGAIISGAFVGDRTSPMSTASLLIATITETDFYNNVKNMLKSGLIPFILTCLTFQLLNLKTQGSIVSPDLSGIKADFSFNIILILPALLIIVLSLFKVSLKYNMLSSIICGIILAYFLQERDFSEIIRSLVFGYKDLNADKSINGGGIISMMGAILIVGISSSYFGIFKESDLLKEVKIFVNIIFDNFPPLVTMEVLSFFIACFSTNQTLSIMLTYEMSRNKVKEKDKLALNLSNSSLLTSVFVPWNISARIPVDTIGCPITVIYFSFYQYYIILINSLIDAYDHRQKKLSH